MSSFLRNSTLEKVFRPFPSDGQFSTVNRHKCRRLAANKGPGTFTPKTRTECIEIVRFLRFANAMRHCQRVPQKSLVISETRQCNATLRCQRATENRYPNLLLLAFYKICRGFLFLFFTRIFRASEDRTNPCILVVFLDRWALIQSHS